MWKFKAILIVIFGVLFFAGLAQVFAASVESNTKMRSVSGEISWIDVKLGKLQLNSDAGQDDKGITEYKINQDETRVTDPSDKKFLVIKDLQVGQHVTIKLIDKSGEVMAQKIIAEPMPEPVLQEATGELEAIDVQVGTIIISQKSSGYEGRRNFLYFVFGPKDIVMMEAPGTEPVQLNLKPGDTMKVEFVVSEGQRHASSIMLLQTAPQTTSTTTTTTTTSTRSIIVEPTPAPASQEVTGELEAIDVQVGTLMIERKPLPEEAGESNLFSFVFEPKDIVIMKSPSMEPVQLYLRPGDMVKVEFMVRDGKRHARSVTLLSAAPKTNSTTTTTTTSTTVTK